ncbi:hypothetical protein [Cyanobium sp. ATX 6A2]|uniref:hypothetical protein n=1 Tax=Cyanobium sp. ATX 6A2 TaxID=2823700 RepID=UPI0037BE66FD
MRFPAGQRLTRRRSSAGPLPPMRPQRPRTPLNRGLRPTYLGLRDHGRVYVADLPRLSDGQLARLLQEAQEMHGSLSRRLAEPGLGDQTDAPQTSALQTPALDEDTRIRAATKLDVTERFLRAIAEEQEGRRSNPALRAAADESLARTFLELARHRLPGPTFESLLQEALSACCGEQDSAPSQGQALPVVLTPAVEATAS